MVVLLYLNESLCCATSGWILLFLRWIVQAFDRRARGEHVLHVPQLAYQISYARHQEINRYNRLTRLCASSLIVALAGTWWMEALNLLSTFSRLLDEMTSLLKNASYSRRTNERFSLTDLTMRGTILKNNVVRNVNWNIPYLKWNWKTQKASTYVQRCLWYLCTQCD